MQRGRRRAHYFDPFVEEKFLKETFRKFLEMRRNSVENLVMESFFYEILVQNRILRLRTKENYGFETSKIWFLGFRVLRARFQKSKEVFGARFLKNECQNDKILMKKQF